MSDKNFVTVTTHRRAFPKRKFADGGKSADSDRPDLDILAKQGLSPEKAPGLPPRIGSEYDMLDRSDVETGSPKAVVISRFEQDPLRLDEGKGSVLKEMLNRFADRVQQHHDYSRQGAAIRAAQDKTGKSFAIGGVNDDEDDPFAVPSDEDLYQQDQEALQRRKVYGSDFTGAMTSGRRTAQLAAPPASVSPSAAVTLPGPRGSASRMAVPSSDEGTSDSAAAVDYPSLPKTSANRTGSNSPAAPDPIKFGSDRRTTSPSATPSLGAMTRPGADGSTRTEPTDDVGSYGSPANKIDWLNVIKKGLGDGRASNPISALGGIGGAALGAYLKHRKLDRQPPPTPEKWSAGDIPTPEEWKGDGGGPTSGEWNGDRILSPSVERLAELPESSSGRDIAMAPDDFSSSLGGDYGGEYDWGFAKGGEVSPSDSGRGMRGRRPMGRPAGAPSYVPPPGSAPTFPGGVGQVAPQYGPPGGGGSQMAPMGAGGPSNAQMAVASAMPPSMGAQIGRGMPPGGPPPGGPGIDPNAMAQILARRAQAQGAVPPGGPPPGGGAMGPMGGPPPGANAMGPMGGPPPGAMPGMGGPPSGPPPGAMPQGGPPSGPPPGAMPGGPPPGGPPSGMGTLPPPGSSDLPGAGTAALGQQQVAQLMQQNAAARSLFGAQAPTSGSTSNQGMMPQGGPPSDPRVQALIAAQMRQQQPQGMAKGGPVEDTEGFSPRAKHERVRQFGDVGKPAEKLPPEPYKKGGKVKHRAPFGAGKKAAKSAPPVPMVTDDDMGTPPAMGLGAAAPAPVPMAAPPSPPPPPVAPPPGPPPGMAEGGVAKLRRGYPNTNGKAKSKKMATGGKVRGCGAAKRGCGFGGVC